MVDYDCLTHRNDGNSLEFSQVSPWSQHVPAPRHRPRDVREGHQRTDHDDHAEPRADRTEGHELQGALGRTEDQIGLINDLGSLVSSDTCILFIVIIFVHYTVFTFVHICITFNII